MIKMVVSSFFNTIIDKEEAIPSTTILEIERIRQKGIIFTINTNRAYKEVLDYNKDFPFIDYIISLNGSCIYDVNKNSCIFKKKLPKSNIKKIMTIFNDYEKTFYSDDIIMKENPKEDDNIYKIEIAIDSLDEVKKITKLNVEHSIFVKDEKMYLEITSTKSNTFNATDQISLKNNINLKNILVICGNESDLTLIKNIPNNYIVENADKNLKNQAKNIVPSNNNKGVESVLKKL